MNRILFCVFCFTSFVYSQHRYTPTEFHLDSTTTEPVFEWKYQNGDDAKWASPVFNDLSWQAISIKCDSKIPPGNNWYRARIILSGRQDDYDVMILKFWGWSSAYEIYWDGHLITQNGIIAQSEAEEKPGKIKSIIKLKREWTTPGEHLVAIRLSNYHPPALGSMFYVLLGYNMPIEANLNRYFYTHLFDIGLFLLAALFSLALFLGDPRKRPYLFFAIFALANIWYSVVSVITQYFNISIVYLPIFQALLYLAAPFGNFFLNSFFIFNFDTPRKKIHLLANAGATLIILIFFDHQHLAWLTLYGVSILAYSVKQKKPGSGVALIGTLIYSVMQILYFYRIVMFSYIVTEVFFIFMITLSLSRQIRAQNQKLEETKLRSLRLESELLKKNIQPHFIMNTLLSIMSWITEDPKKALKLIQALANEFKMINKIAAKKEIPLSEEIKLCETHLELMGYRKDAHYSLIKENRAQNDEKVPPMIFHTLIENGLTHAFQSGEDGIFKLTYDKNNRAVHYKLENGGSLLKKMSAESHEKITEGMGMKYVKARLEESYPQKWRLDYGLNTEKWEVDIIIEKTL